MTSNTSYNLNPYHVLQIDETASYEEVRERFLMLSKTFHPDKQPKPNYDIAKQYFFKIDWAYKALSTPLRRYVYEQFGIKGIELLQKYPFDFSPYENSIDQVEAQEVQIELSQNVKELVFHLYLVKELNVEEELTKTESITYISAVDMTNPNSYRFGKNQSHTISFSTTVPELAQFQNTVEMDVENTFGRDAKSMFRCYSTRRLWEGPLKGVLFKNSILFWGDGVSEELSLSANVSKSIILRFSPIIFEDGSLQIPKIGIQKVFLNQVNFEAETNGSYVSMEVGKSEGQNSKHLSLEFYSSMFSVTTGLERSLDKNCQLVTGIVMSGSSNEGNYLNLTMGYYYGVRLITGPDSKVELRSVFGQQNHLDLRINKGKYNIRVPIFCEGIDVITFEFIKLGVVLAVYICHRIASQKMIKGKTRRQRLINKHYVRLTEDRRIVQRLVSEAHDADRAIMELEARASGLVILKALYGSRSALLPYISRFRHKSQLQRDNIGFYRELDVDKFTKHDSEIYDVTKLVQVSVRGAQLKNYLPTNLPNPCIDSHEQPILYIIYRLRDQPDQLQSDLKHPINIGVAPKPANNVVTRILGWLNRHLI